MTVTAAARALGKRMQFLSCEPWKVGNRRPKFTALDYAIFRVLSAFKGIIRWAFRLLAMISQGIVTGAAAAGKS